MKGKIPLFDKDTFNEFDKDMFSVYALISKAPRLIKISSSRIRILPGLRTRLFPARGK
jgi:hypothetical protein